MKTIVFLLSMSCFIATQAQISYRESAILKSAKAENNNEKVPFLRVVHSNEESTHGEKLNTIKSEIDKERRKRTGFNGTRFKATGTTDPTVNTGFEGHFQVGVPNDNDIAISNDGMIINVSNSVIIVYDTLGNKISSKSLTYFASGSLTINRPFDPHALYDPEEDRFVVVFLDGSSSGYTNMILAFSQTNDPSGDWNFYELPGNVHGDKTWSDYPFPGLTKDELIIPVLLWKDGESGWDSEATNELIWQVDKHKGYAGDTLEYKYYDSIVINGRQVWNTRPVMGGSGLYGPNMYLLANRAVDQNNDSIFLFEITNTLASGQAQFDVHVLTSPVPYGIPPSAYQPDSVNVLRTNYADIHSAFFENNRIHWVSNTIDPNYFSPGIYHGQIEDPGGQRVVSANIYATDTLDLNYPSIAYIGNSAWDNSAMINCLHSSSTTYPGTSVFLTDGEGNYSNLIRVKNGIGTVNSMNDTIERWGDYTGIQRVYDEPGACWLLGSFARNAPVRPGNWTAKVKNVGPDISVNSIAISKGFSMYPNPVSDEVKLEIDLLKSERIQISLTAISGQVMWTEQKDCALGEQSLVFDLTSLDAGTYIVQILSESGETYFNQKLMVTK